QGALAAAAAAHDDEDVLFHHVEAEILHHDKRAVGHGQAAHGDLCVWIGFAHQMSSMVKMTANAESRTITVVMAATTALVVASPTAAEEVPEFMPCMQPQIAMAAPKKTLLKTPRDAWVISTDVSISVQKSCGGMPTPAPTSIPPSMPMMFE